MLRLLGTGACLEAMLLGRCAARQVVFVEGEAQVADTPESQLSSLWGSIIRTRQMSDTHQERENREVY